MFLRCFCLSEPGILQSLLHHIFGNKNRKKNTCLRHTAAGDGTRADFSLVGSDGRKFCVDMLSNVHHRDSSFRSVPLSFKCKPASASSSNEDLNPQVPIFQSGP